MSHSSNPPPRLQTFPEMSVQVYLTVQERCKTGLELHLFNEDKRNVPSPTFFAVLVPACCESFFFYYVDTTHNPGLLPLHLECKRRAIIGNYRIQQTVELQQRFGFLEKTCMDKLHLELFIHVGVFRGHCKNCCSFYVSCMNWRLW